MASRYVGGMRIFDAKLSRDLVGVFAQLGEWARKPDDRVRQRENTRRIREKRERERKLRRDLEDSLALSLRDES